MLNNVRFLLLASLLALPLSAESVPVGTYPAKVVPEQVAVLNLPERGVITNLADETSRLHRGDVIAILNKERTEEEREDMELQIARERLNKKDEMRKLQAQRRKIAFYLSLSEGEKKYATDFRQEDTPSTPESLADIDERLELLQRELDTMERRKRSEFQHKHEADTLKMPFDGRLQYNITLPEDRTKPFELTGLVQNFATVCDDSAFYVTLHISQSELTQLPAENFSVEVSLPEGKKLEGVYAFRRVERAASGSDMLVYFFRLPAEDHETAYSMMGSNTRATLRYEAGEGVELVSKAALLTHPGASDCENWEQLVQLVYPGARMVIQAERYILLSKPSS